jgi:hypothetical protein
MGVRSSLPDGKGPKIRAQDIEGQGGYVTRLVI